MIARQISMGGSQCLHLFSRLLVVSVCHGTSPLPCGKCVDLTVVFPLRPARRCEQTAQVRVASPASPIRRAPQKYRIAEVIPSARSAQTTSISPMTAAMTMLTLLEYPAKTSTTGSAHATAPMPRAQAMTSMKHSSVRI